MKKISILSLHLGFGGIEKSIVALANLLCENYEVEIACTYKLYSKPVFDLDDRVKIKYLTKIKPNKEKFKEAMKKKNIFSIIKEGLIGINGLHKRRKTMIKYIMTKKCDVMIATRDIFDDWLGEYGRKDVKKIGWEHNHYHDNLKYATDITRSATKLDYLVLVSKELEKFYSKELANTNCKCIYIPNVLDNIPASLAKLEEKRLVSVGRLSKEKGYLDLLNIYNLIVKDYPDWKLDIIGDGTEKKQLQDFIKSNNLEGKVVLHGFQKKDYIDKILSNSSIYLMTSYTESFGIVLIEAMSHGLPCIAFSSAEGARELIKSGNNGYLINNRNFGAYIKKTEDLIEKYEVRRRIGKNARKSISKFKGENVAKLWIEILEKK